MLRPMIRALILCLTLAACTPFPEVDMVAGRSTGPAAALLPMDDLLAQTGQPRAQAAGNALTARAAALRSRATALRNR